MAPSRGEQAMSRLQASESWLALFMLWWTGFTNACRFNRAYTICRRSRIVRVKAGQCFVNGSIILASVLVLEKFIVPTLSWLLKFKTTDLSSLQVSLVALYYILWLYPMYILSFFINCIRSNEIAQSAFEVVNEADGKSASRAGTSKSGMDIFALIGENIYSFFVITFFFLQALAASFVPYIGQVLYFLLLSWLYAYYCFEYKWGLARWSLEKRLVFFETNWAFFSGFGSPCVLATFFFSPLVSTGIMAILYPLFVLIATASDPEQLVESMQRDPSTILSSRLPVFFVANSFTLPLLRLLQQRFPAMRKR